ncbi:MAG: secondary thiamine-phosphate synthase enzyme YjbQ [Chthoniobacterales bacterium]|nr:secondary thiamine-phosphate synthase enzyme YjbQ [Chthoniobacterales bacterium]
MKIHQSVFFVPTNGKGTYEITERVQTVVSEGGVLNGLAHVFLRHTSASLVIYENADPTARRDLHSWMEKLVQEGDPILCHTLEGPDDSTSHLRAALTKTSETIPIAKGRLALGTWQGIFLFEHRRSPHRREVVVTVIGI